MIKTNTKTTPDEQIQLFTFRLTKLRNLLERQLLLAGQGSISEVEALVNQSDPMVREILQAGFLELDEFKNQKEALEKLYQQLCLVLTDQKADVAEKLKQVRKGKKTVETYRSNI